MIENTNPTSPEAFAFALAIDHCRGCEKTCRRWRWKAAVRRWAFLIMLVAVATTLSASVSHRLAREPYAVGALSADESMAHVRQMLLNQ